MAALLMPTVATAQDTVDMFDDHYMFNDMPAAGGRFRDSIYMASVIDGDTINMRTGSWFQVFAKYGLFEQGYQGGEKGIRVYGIAITMQPWWRRVERYNAVYEIAELPITRENTRYLAVLRDSTLFTIDTVWLDTASSLIKRRHFMYRTFSGDTAVPVHEFYFDSTHVMTNEFFVGRSWHPNMTFDDWAGHDYDTIYSSPLEWWVNPDSSYDVDEWTRTDIDSLHLIYTTCYPARAWYEKEDLFGACRWHDKTSGAKAISLGGYPRGWIFPIVKLRCSQMKASLEHGQQYARLTWEDAEEGGEYAVQLRAAGGDLLKSDTVADTSYMFVDLDPETEYNIQVRKSCRYATHSYDTTLWGDWQYINFTTNEIVDTTIVDTTIVDTTIVDTTGIRLALGDADFSVSPNPAHGSAVVRLQYAVTETGELTLYDMRGREVLRRPLERGMREVRLDLEDLPAGAYMLKLLTPRGLCSQRLLVQ